MGLRYDENTFVKGKQMKFSLNLLMDQNLTHNELFLFKSHTNASLSVSTGLTSVGSSQHVLKSAL